MIVDKRSLGKIIKKSIAWPKYTRILGLRKKLALIFRSIVRARLCVP